MIENSLINVQFLENNTGEITAGAYLPSIAEIVNSVQHTGISAILIVNNYILGLIWGNDSIYLFDSHSKDENDNLSSSETAVLLKFDSLYNAYPRTLYFHVQFIKVHCTFNAKNAIKSSLKKEQLLAKRQRDLDGKKKQKNIMMIQKRTDRQLKRDTVIKKNP